MTTVYKVWVHVEEIDDEEDIYEDCEDFLPIAIFESEDKDEAIAFAQRLEGVPK